MATGIDVRVNGQLVKGVSEYTVDEESTPVDLSDTTGATGKFNVSSFPVSTLDAKRMRRKPIVLEDGDRGSITGVVTTPGRSSGSVTISANSRLNLLAVERTAQPFSGVLADYFIYMMKLVGITSGFVIDPQFRTVPVVFPGWQADVWLQLKKMLPIYHAEISLVGNNVTLRPMRTRVAVDQRDTAYDWTMDDSSLALGIEGYFYQNEQRVNSLVYPTDGWNEDVQVYQVDAGELIEFDIPLRASVSSVVQPSVVDFVEKEFNSNSVYCVVGNDGLPYPAAQWRAEGGSIRVAINPDTRSLTVTIQGPRGERYAPYRIAASAGPGDNYSSLRLVGTGVFFDKVLRTMTTGVSPDLTSVEVGTTIDSEFISTEEQLMDAMVWTVGRYNGSRQAISVSTTGIHRRGESFENQMFGNVAGARTLKDYIMWRIRRATEKAASISYVAEADTTTADFNERWIHEGLPESIADFNAYWNGYSLDDFATAPLHAPKFYLPAPGVGYGHGPYGHVPYGHGS